MATALKYSVQLKDKQRRRTAFILTLFISFALVAIMYLIKINFFFQYDQSFEYGMEVSYGEDEFGSGQETIPIQSITTRPETENNPEPSESQEEAIEEVERTEASETRIPEPKKETSEPEKQKNQPSTTDQRQVQNEEENKEENTGQGDDQDRKGNKGKETGINEQGLYSGGGGSGGASLSLSGWRWEKEPVINDESNAEGRIIFAIKVDQDGYFISIVPLYPGTTVGDKRIVEKYRQAVLAAYLEPDTQGNVRPAAVSQGTVTFVLKAK